MLARRWHAVGSIRGTMGKVGPLTVPRRECSPLIGSNRGPEYQDASEMPKRLSSAHACSCIRRRDPQTVNMSPGVFVDDAVTSDLFEYLDNRYEVDSDSKQKLEASTHLPLSHPRAAETLSMSDGEE